MRENRVLKWVLCVSSSRVEEISPRVWGVDGDYQMDARVCQRTYNGLMSVTMPPEFWKAQQEA